MLVLIYFFLFLLGAALGSFFNVCISRIPRKRSIVKPASHCPVCQQNIKKRDNIPLLSYLILKARCRYCGTSIPVQYFLVELLTPLAFIFLFYLNGNKFDLIFLKYLIFVSFGIILFFIDLQQKILPDKLTLSLLVVGFIFSFLPGLDITQRSALIASASAFLLFLSLAYLFSIITGKEALGGGDIKLIAGIGMFLGVAGVIFTIITASFLALIVLIVIGHDLKKEFPFGPFLLLAAVLHIFLGNFLIQAYLQLF